MEPGITEQSVIYGTNPFIDGDLIVQYSRARNFFWGCYQKAKTHEEKRCFYDKAQYYSSLYFAEISKYNKIIDEREQELERQEKEKLTNERESVIKELYAEGILPISDEMLSKEQARKDEIYKAYVARQEAARKAKYATYLKTAHKRKFPKIKSYEQYAEEHPLDVYKSAPLTKSDLERRLIESRIEEKNGDPTKETLF